MEDQCSPLSWGYYYQEEGIEELKHSLLYTTLELETTIVSAHEEIARKEDELVQLQNLLARAIKERDEAQEKCQVLKLEKFMLQQLQLQPLHVEAAPANKGVSSSDTDENGVSSPGMPPVLPPPPTLPQLTDKLALKRPLPENGKFLQAVMEAGPLLQTMLLAGPLPQWQHPPPPLNSVDIPPVTISSPPPRPLEWDSSCIRTNGFFSMKRVLVPCEAPDSSPNAKYQKVVHQSQLTHGHCSS